MPGSRPDTTATAGAGAVRPARRAIRPTMATLLAGALTVAALVPAHPALAATAPELPPSGQTFEHTRR